MADFTEQDRLDLCSNMMQLEGLLSLSEAVPGHAHLEGGEYLRRKAREVMKGVDAMMIAAPSLQDRVERLETERESILLDFVKWFESQTEPIPDSIDVSDAYRFGFAKMRDGRSGLRFWKELDGKEIVAAYLRERADVKEEAA